MWDKPRELNKLSGVLLGISCLLLLYGALYFVLRLPQFTLQTVQLTAAPRQVEVDLIEAVVRNELRGNFFTIDLEATRVAFEKLPWVRKVSVRRQFPWRLEVTLEEHVALAHWNDIDLVNTYGEVFQPSGEESLSAEGNESTVGKPAAFSKQIASGLPNFIGEPESAAEVTQMYRAFSEQLAPLQHTILEIHLSPRRAWQLRLNNGLLLKLGRDQSQQRLARFVAVYPHSLAPIQHQVKYVDLRYRNGFAAQVSGKTG